MKQAPRFWPHHQMLTALCLGAFPLAGGAVELTPLAASLPQRLQETLRLRLDTANGRIQRWAGIGASPVQHSLLPTLDIKTAPPSQPASDPLVLRLDQTLAQVPANGKDAQASSLPAPNPRPYGSNGSNGSNGRSKPTDRGETLLLEIYVNDQALPGITRVERMPDTRLVLPLDAWAATRLITPAGGLVVLPDGQRGYAIQDVPGLRYDLNGSLQTLQITAPASAFQETLLVLGSGRSTPPKPAPPGVYLNYDTSITHTQGSPDTGGAVVEGIAFSGPDSLVSGAVLINDGLTRQTVRTETYWRRDLPGSMEALVLGDTIGSGGAWSRPVRYGGFRFARDFSLAPGYVTYPMPAMRGSAALPSTVDVIVNNQRRSNVNVGSGPFDLTNVPLVGGSGEVNLVVRDLRGVETVITQKYYLSPRLLAPGLSDFSLDAGRLRRNFGMSENVFKVF